MSIQNCVDCLAYKQIATVTRITKKDKIKKLIKKRENLGCENCKYIISLSKSNIKPSQQKVTAFILYYHISINIYIYIII